MSTKFHHILQYREKVFFILTLLVFITFTLSFALNSISVFLFIPFFFLDTKENIKEKWRVIKTNKVVLLYALFFLAQVIGICYSYNISLALKRTTVMLPLLFLPAILSVEKLEYSKFNQLLCILKYVIPSTFILYVMIHYFVDGRTLNTFVHFTVKEKIKVSQFYLAFILMVPIFETLRQIKINNTRVSNYILLITTLLIVMLLGNKTTVLFLSIVCLGFINSLRKSNKKRTFLIAMVLSLGVFVALIQVPVIKNRVSVFLKTTDFNINTIITKNSFTHTKNTAEHRVLIDYLSVKEIIKSFPFGVGTGDYQQALNSQYKKVNFKAALKSEYNNHNQYLSEFLKTGIIGGSLFIMLLIVLWKLPKNNLSFYFLLFFTLGCLVESYLVRQHGVVIFAFIIPFLIHNKVEQSVNETKESYEKI